MNEKLYEALEVCLNALETGASLESVLKRFPDMKDDLVPLLETSQQARMLAISEVPEIALRSGKARVLQHAAAMRKSVTQPRKRWSMFAFPRMATSLAIALIFLISGTGLVRASTGALPGDNLYPVKRTWEDVRLILSFDPEIRDELEIEFEDERLHEIDELLAEGRHETIAFAGLVTEQNGDQWVVSGIPVQITPDSKLPAEPVTVGASIVVEGHTNLQGFVEADRVELLEPGISLPSFESVEIEDFGLENNYNDNENEAEIESLKEANKNSNDDNANEDDVNENSNDDDSDDNNNYNSNDNNKSNDDDDGSHSDNDEPDESDDD